MMPCHGGQHSIQCADAKLCMIWNGHVMLAVLPCGQADMAAGLARDPVA
jgi:hypothetical protein